MMPYGNGTGRVASRESIHNIRPDVTEMCTSECISDFTLTFTRPQAGSY